MCACRSAKRKVKNGNSVIGDGWPEGAMHRTIASGYLAEVVARRRDAGDARIATMGVAEQLASDGYGCDYHPNEITARKMADVAVAKIREVTGW